MVIRDSLDFLDCYWVDMHPDSYSLDDAKLHKIGVQDEEYFNLMSWVEAVGLENLVDMGSKPPMEAGQTADVRRVEWSNNNEPTIHLG